MNWNDIKNRLKLRACEILVETNAISFGSFTLTSGKKSPFYIDMRLIPSFPNLFNEVCDMYVKLIKNEITEVHRIAGVPTAGLPFATLVSHKLGLPLIYVRKEQKAHGREKMVEGILEQGNKVVIIDDLITTGGSIVKSVKNIREQGGIVEDVVVFLDREQGGSKNLSKIGVRLHNILQITELIEYLYKRNILDKETYSECIRYINEEKET